MAETRWGWTRSHRARKCRMDDVAGDSAGDSAASPSGHAWLGQASRSRPGISVVTEVMLSRCCPAARSSAGEIGASIGIGSQRACTPSRSEGAVTSTVS